MNLSTYSLNKATVVSQVLCAIRIQNSSLSPYLEYVNYMKEHHKNTVLLISPGVPCTFFKLLIKEVISCLFNFVASSFLVWDGCHSSFSPFSLATCCCCRVSGLHCWFLDCFLLFQCLVFGGSSSLAFCINVFLLIIN